MSTVIHRRLPNQQLKLPDSLHPLLDRIYRQREISDANDLLLGFDQLLPPETLKDMATAVELLYTQLENQSRILIVSDFDADGATSCALVITALRSFGFQNVDYIVPNRFDYGYGLTPEIVELAKTKMPDLIITVDNGISSLEGVAAAKAAGIAVLVTDHHLPGAQSPVADAIVNPNQNGCDFASKHMAGVGVIFYVMLALRRLLRERDWFVEQNIVEPNMANLLDLVALGTVADVVYLDRNNRILVNEGLKRIRAGRVRPGIAALLDIAGRNPKNLVAADLGFAIGPRLNAAGRLDDMSLGIECLLAHDSGPAYSMARELDGMNKDRKQIESDMRDQAFSALNKLSFDETTIPAGLCVYHPDWHQGVVGILASRVKDKYHRPVIAFANASDDDGNEAQIKGSARSVNGFHIRDALDAVAAKNPGLINKFGGHAMAAGLTLVKNNLEAFALAFQAEAERLLTQEQLQAKISSDGEVETGQFTLDCAQQLIDGGPWGQGFPEPCFDGVFKLVQQKIVGEKHLKLVLNPADSDVYLDAIAFNVDRQQWPNQASSIEVAYRLDINEFRGNRNLQLIVEQILDYA